jgi:hypothetical protein
MNPGICQAAGSGYDFRRCLAIALALRIGSAKKAKPAIIAAIRAGINKTVLKNFITEMCITYTFCRRKKLIYIFFLL